MAVDQPPLCPQTGGYGLPVEFGFSSALGNEDCLFLNVYAAPNASSLPVFVWIRTYCLPTVLLAHACARCLAWRITMLGTVNCKSMMTANIGVVSVRRRRLWPLRSYV